MLRKKSPSPDANVVPDIICEKNVFFFLYKFIFFKDHSLDWPYSITTFCKFLYITTLHSSWPEQPGFFFHSISYLALFIYGAVNYWLISTFVWYVKTPYYNASFCFTSSQKSPQEGVYTKFTEGRSIIAKVLIAI